MYEMQIFGVRCRLSLLFPALLAALLLWQPDGLAASCVAASVIHECGHLLTMIALGYPPQACTLGAFGMRIRLGSRLPGYGHNLLISLAGPAANALAACIFLLLNRPVTAAVHLTLGGFNLLPATALDGGEILRCCLCLLGMETLAEPVLRFLSALVLLPLATGSFYLFCRGWGNGTLVIVSMYLVMLVFFSDKCEKNT